MKSPRPSPIVLALSIAGAIFAPAACGTSSSQSAADGGVSGGDSAVGGDGGPEGDGGAGSDGSRAGDGSTGGGKVIFVIPMENKAQTLIYGDAINAAYINGTLLGAYAHTTNFADELPSLVSEPHYVWMESGTNKFTDHTFTGDGDPSPTNSTSSTAHLVTQLDAAGIPWTSYQEGITAGTCPVTSSAGAFYVAKHDPFVFFQDVSGSPPSAANAR
ncbi:MAG: hypothetical protein ABIP89_02560, partial [Polyangiaceae bacterium]